MNCRNKNASYKPPSNIILSTDFNYKNPKMLKLRLKSNLVLRILLPNDEYEKRGRVSNELESMQIEEPQ